MPGPARGARPAAQPGRAGRQRRHHQAQPDGPEPAVQLDRRLHVRGRRAAGRAAGRGAGARPRPAARPARRRGAARAARPRRAGRRRARTAAPRPTAAGPAAPTSCTTCCAGSATSRAAEIDLRCEADAPRGVARGELLAEQRAIEVAVAGEARFAAADDAARYRDALGCALPLGLPVAFTEPVPGRSRSSSAGTPAPTGRSSTDEVARRFGVARDADRSARWPRSRPTSGSCAASSVPRACAASGATSTCCASCAGGRWPRCAARSSRSSRRRWPGSCRRGTASRAERRGVEALVEALGVLPGAPIVASTLETDVLPARVARLPAGRCSTSCARRARCVWVGAGAIGSTDGRVRLCFADQLPLLAPGWEAPGPAGRRAARRHPHRARRARRELLEPAPRRGARGHRRRAARRAVGPGVGRRGHQRLAGAAAGGHRRGRAAAAPRREPGRAAGPGPAGSTASARRPAPGGGAWSRRCSSRSPTPTEAAHATALQLVERHGVVTREAVLAEGVVGGFAGVYGVLKVLEERGQVRRGYFVSGLGAAQFALPGAVDRLRAGARAPERSATPRPCPRRSCCRPPIRPSRTAPRWPGRRRRAGRRASAPPLVVLRDGVPLAWFDRRSHHLVTFPAHARRPELGRGAGRRW